MNIKSILKQLTNEIGVSGDEFSVSGIAAELLTEYADDVQIDSFGNVTGVVMSSRSNSETLMLDAHIDQVGYIVTDIDEKGFVSVGSCGSPDLKMTLAQSVTIHGKEDINGVVSTLPPHVQKENGAPEIGDISIDIGMNKEQAEKIISQGDRVTINSCFKELYGDMVSAPAIDDRSGVCAILSALEMLKGKDTVYNLVISFSTQEETGERGAKQTSFRFQPDKCIAVDVSFGRTPDSAPKESAELGSGVMIGFSPALDKDMSESLRKLAKQKNIPFTVEVMPDSTGTNADAMSVSGKGVKCCTLSFPIRYMHTPIETVNLKDVENTAKLICEYVLGGAEND
ncbi:MAG: M20/M25/M40 family metallo-hydrolase [Oscillospiraceae bacterium]|nr:M20/M25/M40 family metallo-hydrolase [Oscillospiraceae bacterium]